MTISDYPVLGRLGSLKKYLFVLFILLSISPLAPAFADTLVSGRIDTDTTWTLADSPYVVTSTIQIYGTPSETVTLTIEPGVEVRFDSSRGLQIGSGANRGALVAQGTALAPIIFTRNTATGNWGSLNFQDGTDDSTTLLEHVQMQYSRTLYFYSASPTLRDCSILDVAGGVTVSAASPILENVTLSVNNTYGIYLTGTSAPQISGGSLINTSSTGYGVFGYGSPSISDYSVSIIDTPGKYGLYLANPASALSVTNSNFDNGLYLGSYNIQPTITGNTFSRSDSSPLHADVNLIGQLLENNTFTGMTAAGKIEVMGSRISQDSLWKKWPAPYVIFNLLSVYKDTTTPATLTIEPGTEVRFNGSAGLKIGYGTNKGALIARGTALNPIIFTRNSATGSWKTLDFQDGTDDATSQLEHVRVEYGTGVYLNAASPTLRNCTLQQTTGSYGLYISNSSSLMENLSIEVDTTYGMYLINASPQIIGGSLINNKTSGNGIYGSGSPSISDFNLSIVDTPGKYGLHLANATSAFSVTNSTIDNGLYLTSTAPITATITGNSFSRFDSSPLHIGASLMAQVLETNTFTGMTSAGQIEIVGEQISQDTLWKKWPAPYVVSGAINVYKDTTSPATLTIEPGVEMRFNANGSLVIGNGTKKGALIAQGTENDRITFTRNGSISTWGYFTFNDGTDDGTTLLENVDMSYSAGLSMYSSSPTIRNSTVVAAVNRNGLLVSYGAPILENVDITADATYGIYVDMASPQLIGGSLTNNSATGHGIYGYRYAAPIISDYTVSIVDTPGKYGLYMAGSTSELSVTNSTIDNSLYLYNSNVTPSISGNTFTRTDSSPLHVGANIVGQILNTNTFAGMTTAGRIEVAGESIKESAVWKRWPAPYILTGTTYVKKDTVSNPILTLDPGVQLRFNASATLIVGYSTSPGTLLAQGTTAEPIIFTSNQSSPTPGYWKGITMNGAGNNASILNHVVVEYGGKGTAYSNANLMLSSGSPQILNSVIRQSTGSGIYLYTASAGPTIQGCQITDNKWGIYSRSSNPVIGNSTISNNSTAGLWNGTTAGIISARGNWWGAGSGPTHSSNASGTGGTITDGVSYNPWLGQMPNEGLAITEPSITPETFNADGGNTLFGFKLSSAADWTINVSDSLGAPVRTLSGNGSIINQAWFGDRDQGDTAANGDYSVSITAIDPATAASAAPLQGTLSITSQLSSVIDSPVDNQIFGGGETLSIAGTASAVSDFQDYLLAWGAGENPIGWTAIKNSTVAVVDGVLGTWSTNGRSEGLYTLRLMVNDSLDNSIIRHVKVKLLWIQDQAVSEPYFSPNADTVKDQTVISASLTHPADWTVSIADAQGVTMRTYSGRGDAILQPWDGKDEFGTVVDDGTYTWTIDALEGAAQAPTVSGTVVLDATAPDAELTSPIANAIVFNSVTLIGTVNDINFESYEAEIEPLGQGVAPILLTEATEPVVSGPLALWETNDDTGYLPYANGDYLLRLTVSDLAGNRTVAAYPVTLDNLQLTGIEATRRGIDTYLGESSDINFTLSAAADVTLNIIPEKLGQTGVPVYQAIMSCPLTGSYSFNWNGKNSSGLTVPDEAYLYVLEASDGQKTEKYLPTLLPSPGTVSCSSETEYDAYRNDPLAISYTVTDGSRVNLKVAGSPSFTLFEYVAKSAGSYDFNWDGRDSYGMILPKGSFSYVYCQVAEPLPENHIVTSGDTPRVTLVTADPYAVHLSFGQFTKIRYELSQAAAVTVMVGSSSGTGVVLLNGELQAAGGHEIEWNGLDVNDANGKQMQVAKVGGLTVTIRATNPTTGASSTTLGSLIVGY